MMRWIVTDLIHADADVSRVVGFATFGKRAVVVDDRADPVILAADQIGRNHQEGVVGGIRKTAIQRNRAFAEEPVTGSDGVIGR